MAPSVPTAERREYLLDVLAHFVARGGAGSLLSPPVVPGNDAFPEPWRPTRGAVIALLRRLAWHAGNPRAVIVVDERLGAPPTERKPATRIGLLEVDPKQLHFRLEFLGTDDIAGTLAHELGVAHAAVNRPDAADPYRDAEQPRIEIDADRDLARGSIASVYIGLGAVAANAGYQQYSRGGQWNGAYVPNEYDVLRAGYVPMSELAFLLAVQAAVRGDDVPKGLSPPQRDEVAAWLAVLAPEAAALRERLGIAADATGEARATPEMFEDIDLDEDAPTARKVAFRWRTHRGGVGMIAGAALGACIATAIAAPNAAIVIVVAATASGHVAGRAVRVPRCSACATVVKATAKTCPHCAAALRGDIAALSERLEAEERLEHPDDDAA